MRGVRTGVRLKKIAKIGAVLFSNDVRAGFATLIIDLRVVKSAVFAHAHVFAAFGAFVATTHNIDECEDRSARKTFYFNFGHDKLINSFGAFDKR